MTHLLEGFLEFRIPVIIIYPVNFVDNWCTNCSNCDIDSVYAIALRMIIFDYVVSVTTLQVGVCYEEFDHNNHYIQCFTLNVACYRNGLLLCSG